MDDNHYKLLVKHYLEGTATDEELEVFVHLLKEGKLDVFLKDALAGDMDDEDHADPIQPSELFSIHKKRAYWLKYAAAMVLLLAAAFAFYFQPLPSDKRSSPTPALAGDVLPGGNKAFLTLSNGKKIVLDKVGIGKVAEQGRAHIEKIEDGYLAYVTDKNLTLDPQETIAYNTISTPKAGQYQVVLADGTKVWLNSFSSITFPTVFGKEKRQVKITGEVYFEIAKNQQTPFLVEARGQTVEVLGTQFNINAYDDESTIKTTLLEGSIKVSYHRDSKILKPGEQAEIRYNQVKVAASVDPASAIAWKNGYFVFDNADLPSLMRQLSRWYDVQIVYQGDIREHEFVGEIKRASNLSNVLKILEISGIKFRIVGKNLLIQP